MGGNALTAVTVLSQAAGYRAAADARGGGGRRVKTAAAAAATACGGVNELARAWAGNAAEKPGSAPAGRELRDRIRAAVGAGLGVVRTSDGLAAFAESLAGLREVLPRLGPTTARDRMIAVECLGALLTAEVVGAAALRREESRGGHFRADFPAEDGAWTKHIVLEPLGVAVDAADPPQYRTRIDAVDAVSPPAGV